MGKKNKIQSVRGFKDWLPEEFSVYQFLMDSARKILKRYNFKEIKIPILEKTELFVRSIGEVTDIVQKETYSFQDRNKEWVTLRPEATAGICRMFIQHGLFTRPKPVKLFTIGPMFRHERPQKGRLREFYQISVEFFGNLTPFQEGELIFLALQILKSPVHFSKNLKVSLKEPSFVLEINSLGCEKCRPLFRNYLVEALSQKKDLLCETCQERLERNPLRILDCKNEGCKEVLRGLKGLSDFWCEGCKKHFEKLTESLKIFGIEYVVNPFLVRGLDYYVRTIFEIKAEGLGAQDTVCAGGRYDGLIPELGGPEINGTGFAIGLERWALSLFGETLPDFTPNPEVFIAPLTEKALSVGAEIAKTLRTQGIITEISYELKSVKALLRDANKMKARFAILIGDEEIKEGALTIKDLEKGEQKKLTKEEVLNFLKTFYSKKDALEEKD